MFFLLRMTFWLGVVLVLLPSGATQHEPSASRVGASDAISAASATVTDMRGFCTRQPDACTVGSELASAIGYKAQAGAKMLYDMLSEALGPRETGSLASGSPRHGAVAKVAAESSSPISQSTLTSTDVAPVWRGPPSRKDGKHSV